MEIKESTPNGEILNAKEVSTWEGGKNDPEN